MIPNSRSVSASEFTVSFLWPKTSAAAEKRLLKSIGREDPYRRELSVYERLRQNGLTEILGFNVPQLIGADDDLRVIEMSIVTRPFVLDFAGAYISAPPTFSDEIWAEWEAEKRDQFGIHWPKVQAVREALEEMDIYMVDVSPSNIVLWVDSKSRTTLISGKACRPLGCGREDCYLELLFLSPWPPCRAVARWRARLHRDVPRG